jgi:hypothetical protein
MAQFVAPPLVAPRRAKGGRLANAFLLLFALVTALITLHRNGILFDLSKSLGMQRTYLGLERSVLGPPSILTPRGVELLDTEASGEPVATPAASGR